VKICPASKIGINNLHHLIMDLINFLKKSRYLVIILFPIIGLFIYHQIGSSSFLPPKQIDQKWVKVFNDDFNEDKLNTSLWTTCYDWFDKKYEGCSNNGNHEEEWYRPRNVAVDNGLAILTATKLPTKGWDKTYEKVYQYESGMLSTGRGSWNSIPKRVFKYGYFEARLKIPKGQAVWPAFWLLPAEKDVWPPEIDIMEMVGQDPKTILLTYHWKDKNGEHRKDNTNFYAPTDFSEDYHVYSLNWQPNKIEWYIDGVERKSVVSSDVPSIPMELVINLAVGGDLPGNITSKTPNTTKLMIDYVRVFQLQTK
jgi:beta-glucanase (GH16 family)